MPENVKPENGTPRLQTGIGEARIINRLLRTFSTEIMSRAELAGRIGQSYYSPTTGKANRDLYEALGYPRTIEFDDYLARFDRGDIAHRIITAPVNASWRLPPNIIEQIDGRARDDNPTQFEEVWADLVKNQMVLHYLRRADTLAGIGAYGVLLMGFDDGPVLETPVTSANKLLYLMPYMQGTITIAEWEENPRDERYGKPKIYTLQMKNFRRGTIGGGEVGAMRVHHSRIIHVAEGCTDDDVYGTPRLKNVFNRLQDLELVAGGSAEMYWRGASPGTVVSLDPETDPDTLDLSDLRDQVDKFVHHLERFVRGQGIEVKQLSPTVVSPVDQIQVQIDLISAATNIPKRILMGSERGELASSQDETNWFTRIDERRSDYVEPMILRPFIDRLIQVGVLPDVKEYVVEWPSLFTPNEKDKAETNLNRVKALGEYVKSLGADEIVPPSIFLRKFLEMDDDEIEEINQVLEDYMAEQEEEAQAAAEAAAEMAAQNPQPYTRADGTGPVVPDGEGV